MERTEVRSVLGIPRLSSKYWRFDLFRFDTEQTEVVFAVTPWPIPFAQVKDELHRYTLVSYDDKGRTNAIASDLFRKPAAWRIASPIEYDYPSLYLRSGELMFFVVPQGTRGINMLVAPPCRDLFLQSARSSTHHCLAVLGCGDRGCGNQLSIDAGPPRGLPVRNSHFLLKQEKRDSWLQGIAPSGPGVAAPWLESLVAFRLTAGDHVLEISAKQLGGAHSLMLACRPGEITYFVINASHNGSFMNPALVDWQIQQTDTMPELFARRPLVILNEGQWYMDVEPSE